MHICRLRGWHCGIPAWCLFSSGIRWAHVSLTWKEWLLQRPGDRSPQSLSALKRKGKIIAKLVLEENSNIRSKKVIFGSFSFLISISTMKNSQRNKDTMLGRLCAASSNVALSTYPTYSLSNHTGIPPENLLWIPTHFFWRNGNDPRDQFLLFSFKSPLSSVLNTEMHLLLYMVKINSRFSDSYWVFKWNLHTSSLWNHRNFCQLSFIFSPFSKLKLKGNI